ncbi:uncharacterized protein H6S33_010256 [Morchella sextelata]|uniref:uncharacterized protein n=1 Tax=Morchella sextelata TaxID=1174677 RepID=UPI001D04F9CC|nr:uncharacterized protein H6S33_010256 [Morchella sextelata]KAH0612204.1 hypothetical protein H6S33_010256 [Morchella sextelata]
MFTQSTDRVEEWIHFSLEPYPIVCQSSDPPEFLLPQELRVEVLQGVPAGQKSNPFTCQKTTVLVGVKGIGPIEVSTNTKWAYFDLVPILLSMCMNDLKIYHLLYSLERNCRHRDNDIRILAPTEPPPFSTGSPLAIIMDTSRALCLPHVQNLPNMIYYAALVVRIDRVDSSRRVIGFELSRELVQQGYGYLASSFYARSKLAPTNTTYMYSNQVPWGHPASILLAASQNPVAEFYGVYICGYICGSHGLSMKLLSKEVQG